MAATSLIAGASELARKARMWLGHGQRSQTTLDAAPVSYELETQAKTSESFPFVFIAVYTVGPRIIDVTKKPSEEPLLLHDKLVSPPDHVSPGGDCPSRVRNLVQLHVREIAAGTAAEQVLVDEGTRSFVREVLRRVNADLSKSGELLIYRIKSKSFAVQVPCDKVSVGVVAQEGAAPTPGFALPNDGANQQLELNLSVRPGEAAVTAAVVDPVTKKQIKVAAVGVDVQVELEGKKTLRFKLDADAVTN